MLTVARQRTVAFTRDGRSIGRTVLPVTFPVLRWWRCVTGTHPVAWAVLAVCFAAVVTARAVSTTEFDVLWQARDGMDVLNGTSDLAATVDVWGWDPMPWLWVKNSPVWNVVLGTAFRLAGWVGLALVTGALGLLLVGWLVGWAGAQCRARGCSLSVPAAAGLLAVLVASSGVTLQPRPALPAMLMLLFGLLLLDRMVAAWDAGAPRWWGYAAGWAALCLTGMWVHGSWLVLVWVGPVYVAAVAGRRRLLLVGVLSAVAVTASTAGPLGLAGLTQAADVRGDSAGLIVEWLSLPELVAGVPLFGSLMVALLVVAVAGVVAGLRVPRLRGMVVVVTLLTVGGVAAVRFLPWAALLGAAVLAVAVSRPTSATAAASSGDPAPGDGAGPRVVDWARLGTFAAAATAVTVTVATVAALLMTSWTPRALAPAAMLPTGCLLVSDPSLAAPVLLTRPDVRVWVDGRNDYWGADRYRQTLSMLEGDQGPGSPLNAATCALVDSRWPRFADSLAADRSWEQIGETSGVRVYARR